MPYSLESMERVVLDIIVCMVACEGTAAQVAAGGRWRLSCGERCFIGSAIVSVDHIPVARRLSLTVDASSNFPGGRDKERHMRVVMSGGDPVRFNAVTRRRHADVSEL